MNHFLKTACSTNPQLKTYVFVGLVFLFLCPIGMAKQIGDPGWTFDTSHYDPHFPAMKEWARAGVEGGIPLRESTLAVQTLSPVVGDEDMADNIQAAIDAAAAAGGGVVLLKNGTYPIQSSFNLRSKVILRGQSPEGTILSSTQRYYGGHPSRKAVTLRMDAVEYGGLEDFTMIYKVSKDGREMHPVDHDWTFDSPDSSKTEHAYKNERVYHDRANYQYHTRNDLYVNFVRLQGGTRNAWIDNCRFLESGSNLITGGGEHITIRNCVVKGSFQKGVSGNGYGINISGRYFLMTGNHVSHVRHWAIQQGAQYCVVYDNHSEVDLNFHQGDLGQNLIEKSKIHLPKWASWRCFQTGASYHGDPGVANMFYNNDCIQKKDGRLYADNQVYTFMGRSVKPLASGYTPSGGTLYAVRPTDEPFYRIELSERRVKLIAGDAQDLDATVYGSPEVDHELYWHSTDPRIATVDQNGLVTSLNAGKCRILATSLRGYFVGESLVTVLPERVKQNLAFNCPVVLADEPEKDSHGAGQLVDGDVTTRWSTQGFPQSVVIDLGQVRTFNRTELITYMDRAYQFLLEVKSTQDADYTVVVDRLKNTTRGKVSAPIINTFAPVKGRYLKLTIPSAHAYNSGWVSLQELGVYMETEADRNQTQATPEQVRYYVSPTGKDSWFGSLAEARADGKDGPFATLKRAQKAARQHPKAEVLVELRGGTYTLRETLVLSRKDTRDHGSLTFKAYPGETPILSSGITVTGWKKATSLPSGMAPDLAGKIWQASMPKGVSDFKVMFKDGKKLRRARGLGFDPIPHKTKRTEEQRAKDRGYEKTHFFYPPGTVRNWSNIRDIEVIARPRNHWVMNILGLTAVDEEQQVATTHVPATYTLDPVRNKPSMWIENAPECLTKAGQWIVNTKERVIYYYPEDSKHPGDTITVPALKILVKVEGAIDVDGPKDTPVKGIVFDRLTFTQADRGTWKVGDAGMQHDWEMLDSDDSLVRFRGAEDCQVLNCTFRDTGASALRLDMHAQNNLVKGCEIHDLGGAGIILLGHGPGTKDVNKYNTICNNHIFNIGQIYWHSHGIILWQSGENRVRNNLIHDVPRKAICMSGVRIGYFNKRQQNLRECGKTVRWHEVTQIQKWEDALPFLHTRNNIVEYNEAYKCLMRLGDGGVMNISGAGTGNTIRRNYVHDIYTAEWTDGVLRTDDYQTGSLIEENIVFRADCSALVMKGENVATNNYFIDAGKIENAILRITLNNKAAVFSRNVLLKGEELTQGRTVHHDRHGWNNMIYAPMADPSFKGGVVPTAKSLKNCTMDYNVLYSGWAEGQSPELQKYINAGHEAHSVFTDPGFVDWKNGDFTPTEGSPIYKLGINPLDTQKVGLRNDFPKRFLEQAKAYSHEVF